MAISSPNVQQQPKITDYEKGMQFGAQLSTVMNQMAQMRMQQAQNQWNATLQMINVAGKDVVGGDGAVAAALQPLIADSLAKVSGSSLEEATAKTNDYFSYIKENPNAKHLTEQTAVSYIWNGEYAKQEQAPPQTEQTQTQNVSQPDPAKKDNYKVIKQYTKVDPKVDKAFTDAGYKGQFSSQQQKQSVMYNLLQAGFDKNAAANIIAESEKLQGRIPATLDPQDVTVPIDAPTTVAPVRTFSSDTPPAQIATNAEGVIQQGGGKQPQAVAGAPGGKQPIIHPPTQGANEPLTIPIKNKDEAVQGNIKKTDTEAGTSYFYTPIKEEGGKPLSAKKMVNDLITFSGVNSKGAMAGVDANRFYKMVAEENIGEIARLSGKDEKMMVNYYKANPNQLMNDFSAYAPNMTDIKLPVLPGSPEYAQMFTAGVSEGKMKEIKTALTDVRAAVKAAESGTVQGEELTKTLVDAADKYQSKLQRVGKRIAVDPSYMRSVMNKMGGGDPTNVTDEGVARGIISMLDTTFDSGSRQARISQETQLQMEAKLKMELGKYDLEWAKFRLELQKAGFDMSMSTQEFMEKVDEFNRTAVQNKIKDEKGERSDIEKMIVNMDKRIAELPKGIENWQKNENDLARKLAMEPEFEKLYIARAGLMSSMYGKPVQYKKVRINKSEWGWGGTPTDVYLPYVDTSAGLGPTATERGLMGQQQQAQTQAAATKTSTTPGAPNNWANNSAINDILKDY